MAVGYTGSDFAIARYLGENVPQLDAFSLQTPFDQATAQNFASLPCNWTDAFGATSYEMEVDITPTFTSSPQIYTVGVSSKTLTNLTPNTQYFWRVRASDGSNWGAYSATCSFTTNSLDIFTHISPAKNSVGTSFVNLTLDWTDLVGASSYEIELDSSQTFSMNPVVFTSIDSNYIVSSLVEAKGYYWRVRASNGTVWGQWSAPWKFTTDMDDAAIAEIKNAQFEVYPNPTAGIVQINFDEIVNAIQVKVINSIGQLVELKSFNSASQIDLNLKGNSGVYFIEIHAENGFLGCSLSACSASLILFKWE